MLMSLVGTPTVTSRAEASWLLPPPTDYSNKVFPHARQFKTVRRKSGELYLEAVMARARSSKAQDLGTCREFTPAVVSTCNNWRV